MPTTVVVLNDDHHLFSLLEQLLAGDPRLLVHGKGRNELSATALCWEALPEAIVIEQHAAGVQWWALLPDLRRYCPDSCIVLLTDLAEGDRPPQAKLADHVLPRTSPWQHLIEVLVPPVCEDEVDEPLPIAQ